MRVKVSAVIICVLLLLTGCKAGNEPLEQALALRSTLQKSEGCSFQVTVNADYGEKLYTFKMDCKTDKAGSMTFTVTEPATLNGITGKIDDISGKLTFDDKVLAFETIADGQITPVTAPWLFVNTLKSGYLTGCAQLESGLEISIDDSYGENPLQLNIVTDGNVPVSAEIYYKGRRIMTLQIENFTFS